MALNASDVSAGDDILAAHNNALIDDIEQHVHGGADTAEIAHESNDFHYISNVFHIKFKYTIDNAVLDNNSAAEETDSASYVKVKETALPSGLPSGTTLRISFTLYSFSANPTAYGKIYRNGGAVGTERSTSGGAPGTTYTEDIAGWEPEDLVQVYGYHSTGGGGNRSGISNLKIQGIITKSPEIFTQQDP